MTKKSCKGRENVEDEHDIGLDRKKRLPLETNCAYACVEHHRTITIRDATYARCFKGVCRKMRTLLWLVGFKKVSKRSRCMTSTDEKVYWQNASVVIRAPDALFNNYVHLAVARLCSDLDML